MTTPGGLANIILADHGTIETPKHYLDTHPTIEFKDRNINPELSLILLANGAKLNIKRAPHLHFARWLYQQGVITDHINAGYTPTATEVERRLHAREVAQ